MLIDLVRFPGPPLFRIFPDGVAPDRVFKNAPASEKFPVRGRVSVMKSEVKDVKCEVKHGAKPDDSLLARD